MVLKWDNASEVKGKHSKFQKIWLGPYDIAEKIEDATYRLQSLQGDLENIPVNASILERYFSYFLWVVMVLLYYIYTHSISISFHAFIFHFNKGTYQHNYI